jgi:hypothetical protein
MAIINAETALFEVYVVFLPARECAMPRQIDGDEVNGQKGLSAFITVLSALRISLGVIGAWLGCSFFNTAICEEFFDLGSLSNDAGHADGVICKDREERTEWFCERH